MLPKDAPETAPCRRAVQTCLWHLPRWRSPTARAREARFWRDARRPATHVRVLGVSDLHFDFPKNEEWVHRLSLTQFQEDVLIVAGNVADSLSKVRACLTLLRARFRRVFFTPGNHDVWLHGTEAGTPDSLCKLLRLLHLCDELDVDMFPAAVCDGLSVVPLFSWYNADMDEDDPFLDARCSADRFARWPLDKCELLWRYMLRLNQRSLQVQYPGNVITFSHFLPRADLPYAAHVADMAKSVGCPQLDEQVRHLRSRAHVFGHSNMKCDKLLSAVRYVQCPLGDPKDHSPDEPLRCLFDGQDASGGFVSKVMPLSG